MSKEQPETWSYWLVWSYEYVLSKSKFFWWLYHNGMGVYFSKQSLNFLCF